MPLIRKKKKKNLHSSETRVLVEEAKLSGDSGQGKEEGEGDDADNTQGRDCMGSCNWCEPEQAPH